MTMSCQKFDSLWAHSPKSIGFKVCQLWSFHPNLVPTFWFITCTSKWWKHV